MLLLSCNSEDSVEKQLQSFHIREWVSLSGDQHNVQVEPVATARGLRWLRQIHFTHRNGELRKQLGKPRINESFLRDLLPDVAFDVFTSIVANGSEGHLTTERKSFSSRTNRMIQATLRSCRNHQRRNIRSAAEEDLNLVLGPAMLQDTQTVGLPGRLCVLDQLRKCLIKSVCGRPACPRISQLKCRRE